MFSNGKLYTWAGDCCKINNVWKVSNHSFSVEIAGGFRGHVQGCGENIFNIGRNGRSSLRNMGGSQLVLVWQLEARKSLKHNSVLCITRYLRSCYGIISHYSGKWSPLFLGVYMNGFCSEHHFANLSYQSSNLLAFLWDLNCPQQKGNK